MARVTPRLLAPIAVATLALACRPESQWHLEGQVRGALAPSAADRSIALLIDADRQPSIFYRHATGASFFAGCTREWNHKPFTCLLPPGASLESVSIEGRCAGCQAARCAPPAAARVDVATEDVAIWQRGSTLEQRLSIAAPLPMAGGAYGLPILEVLVETGSTNIDMRLQAAAPDGTPYQLRDGPATAWCVRGEYGMRAGTTACRYNIDLAPGAAALHLALRAEATLYGRCATAAPCSAPSTGEAALRIASISVR